jgi:hypothetical protein
MVHEIDPGVALSGSSAVSSTAAILPGLALPESLIIGWMNRLSPMG